MYICSENPPSSRVLHRFTLMLVTDAPIYTCFAGNIMWSFGIYCAKYGAVIGNHYKITTLQESLTGGNFGKFTS